MGGPSATTTRSRKNWCWRRNMAVTVARRSAYARTSSLRLRHFPAHWAPNGMVHYDKKEFPERYRNGLFIAFHGSWNRAPYPQGGYNVVFQPMAGDHASGGCEIFADGFAGAVKSPDKADHRPNGLAVGPDGSLYISDDVRGRIYRIVYRGGLPAPRRNVTPCPSATAPAGDIVEAPAKPPEGTHPDAGAATTAGGAVPEGATREMVALGERIYHGQVGGAACTGCHGASGRRLAFGSGSDGEEMAVERWQLRGNQENDYRGRGAAKTISQPDAGDGRRATNS